MEENILNLGVREGLTVEGTCAQRADAARKWVVHRSGGRVFQAEGPAEGKVLRHT